MKKIKSRTIMIMISGLLFLFFTALSSASYAATISGTVKDSAGNPITGNEIRVNVFSGDPCGNYDYIGGTPTDSSGTYTITGLPAGTYYLRTWNNWTNYVNEWHTGGSPDPSDHDCSIATSITVASGENATGKDFQLDLGGSISGRVTTGSGDPIEDLRIQIFSDICYQDCLDGGGTDANGDYLVSELPQGNVYVRACADCNHQNYINEFWNDIPEWKACELATPVQVTGGGVTEDINFALDPGPRRFAWEPEIFVYGGIFGAAFDVVPGFNGLIEGATLTGPNGFSYNFDMESNIFLWDNECSYMEAWSKLFPSPIDYAPIDYGLYTLTVSFLDGGQATYSKNLTEAHPAPVDSPTMSHTVNPDGSIDFSWTPPSTNQYYQVRIFGVDDHDRYYRSSANLVNETSLHVSVDDLRCLKQGEEYTWYVRAFDVEMPVYNAYENSNAITFTYTPTALEGRTTWFEATSYKGNLELYFNVRPGSRDNVTQAIVTGPDSFSYAFNLTSDWFDISTESRFVNGWIKKFNPPFSFGEYALDITFSDCHTEHLTYNLQNIAVTPVDSATMGHQIHEDGPITFSWDLPAPVTGQKYQIRIRKMDQTKEYLSSSSVTDGTQVTFSFWDLRALVHGESYQWFVRAYDENFNTMEQSGSLYFLYDPFSLIDSDNDGLPDNLENEICTDPNDADTDDDGILDGDEDADHDGILGLPDNETHPCQVDTDGDGTQDGTESGVTEGHPTDTNAGIFEPDLDPTTTTNPLDADTDDDGILDGDEDADHDGILGLADNESHPCQVDTDNDGIQDGTELGYTFDNIGSDTDTDIFQPDLDPTTTSDPLNDDSDGDSILDGEEDLNHNGRVDEGESNLNMPTSNTGLSLDMVISTRCYDDTVTNTGIEPKVSVPENGEVWIAVVAQGVTDLDTYQVEVSFDTEKVEFIEGVEEDPSEGIENLLKKNGGETSGFQAVENVSGTINIENALSYTDCDNATEGTGIIALLKFRVSDDDSDNHVTLSNAFFTDCNSNEKEVINLTNGEFIVFVSDGDVAPLGNRDKEITVGDALVTLRFALGLEIPTQEDIQHGDVAPLGSNGHPNPDGEITVGDALVILRKALGIIEF